MAGLILSGKLLSLLLIWTIYVRLGDCGAVLTIQLFTYFNTAGTEWDGDCCDSTHILGCGTFSCDHDVTFCLDAYSVNDANRASSSHCSLYRANTGKLANLNVNNLGGSVIGNIHNPIVINMEKWPDSGHFVAKFETFDVDDWKIYGSRSLVDYGSQVFTPTRFIGPSVANWSNTIALLGSRNSYKTSLTLRYKGFCQDNYYGPLCNVYCEGQDSETSGHFTCDVETGRKICLQGWDEPEFNCKLPADDCYHHACLFGECKDLYKTYTCDCWKGYIGNNCQHDINECSTKPCVAENTIQCINTNGSYHCHCKEGFAGSACELHLCDGDLVCQNGGTCVGTGECICATGFEGPYCQLNICNRTKCLNGGKCNHGRCYCPVAYTGAQCETESNPCKNVVCYGGATCVEGKCMNACDKKPCKNSGTCYVNLDVPGDFHCVCLPRFTGTLCESMNSTPDVSGFTGTVCAGITCLNGGSCLNGACVCRTGYTDKVCSTVVNYCDSSPCPSGVSCYSSETNFKCVCPPHLTGQRCETKLEDDLCKSVNCLNEGHCVLGRCECAPHYTGDDCSKLIGCYNNPCTNGTTCYQSSMDYICVCSGTWSGHKCDVQTAESAPVHNPVYEAKTLPIWVLILIGLGVLFIIILLAVMAFFVIRKYKRKSIASAGTNTDTVQFKSKGVSSDGSFTNPSFNGDTVYENTKNKDAEYGNIKRKPKAMPAYAKPNKKPPLPARSVSYAGTTPAEASSASGASTDNPKSIYNYTSATAEGYSFAKVDKKRDDKKEREIKTPKHLEDRYEAMKAAILQNNLNKD